MLLNQLVRAQRLRAREARTLTVGLAQRRASLSMHGAFNAPLPYDLPETFCQGRRHGRACCTFVPRRLQNGMP